MTTTATREKPILFSGPIVRAILDGRKTQTRRIVKLSDPSATYACHDDDGWPMSADECGDWTRDKPRYEVGCNLLVKEALRRHNNCAVYDANYPDVCEPVYDPDEDNAIAIRWKWKRAYLPSMFMPLHASRITLEITEVRIERLNDLTEEDAIAEGAQCAGFPAAMTNRGAFIRLWNQLNGANHWSENCWVWVVGFKRVTP